MKLPRYSILLPILLSSAAAFAACGSDGTRQCFAVRDNRIISQGSCQVFVCSNAREHMEEIEFGQYRLYSSTSIGSNRSSASINNQPAVQVRNHRFGNDTRCLKTRSGSTMICVSATPPEGTETPRREP
ncbi:MULTISPECIES: hypothetical protein [Eikenella]|uniref:Secreted protein n=1 Tax=Eikenella longinqua TaxID=1795827 RepID=A0A1A9RYW7_9NEIS|nr:MULTISPECIES: hypothetical protein [Eikenella]OAM29177.1 hypothetical protein A7P95_04305 [Eikenella longinqua]